MSMSRAILDSSPLRLPAPPPNALKRSASTASLPTPPRTVRKRARSRGSVADSSDEEDALLPVLSSDAEEPPAPGGDNSHKRRRVDALAASLTEDAFWLDLPAASHPASTSNPASTSQPRPKAPEKPTRIPRPRRVSGAEKVRARPAAAARIKAQSKATAFSLLTPPATRHRPPLTPPPRRVSNPRSRKTKPLPVRDSPHNPFLAPASPRPRPSAAQRAEQPTLTYVFRGKKQEFMNPHYGVGRSARAQLPVSHPDFSPSDNCTPRRLFAPRAGTGRGVSPDPWDTEEEAEGEEGAGVPRMTLAAEFAKVGEREGGSRGLLERVLEEGEE